MAGGQQVPEQYTVPHLARVFHSLPHLNVSLHLVNNTFNPHSEIYLEVSVYLCALQPLRLFSDVFVRVKGRRTFVSSWKFPWSGVSNAMNIIWHMQEELYRKLQNVLSWRWSLLDIHIVYIYRYFYLLYIYAGITERLYLTDYNAWYSYNRK